MRRIDLYFLVLASACLIVGVCLGLGMGLAHDFRLAPVHAHVNLVGWTSLALFGLTYRAYPALGQSWLGALHFYASSIGAVAFALGTVIAVAQGSPRLVIAAALLWLAGAVLFFVNLLTALFAPAKVSRAPALIPRALA